MAVRKTFSRGTALLLSALFLCSILTPAEAASKKQKVSRKPAVTAKACVIVDADNGRILYAKNPHMKLPPASTTKVMTVLVATERLSMKERVTVGRRAAGVTPSRAGLTPGADYSVQDLIKASLVSSSNDAAVALAEAAAGSEQEFAKLMNKKAKQLGMDNTRFVNATGLTDKKRRQYSTAYDLTKLMRAASRDKRLDEMMGLINITVMGSDGKVLALKAHNKMLWRIPKFVKGKTGWTFASRHTFVGTDYARDKSIAFALLSSQKPWTDIERLASFGLRLAA